jgi:predicted Zn-dependent peptidase
VIIGWHIPAFSDPSYPAYQAAASRLGGGNFSRLYKRLVKEKKLCAQISMGTGTPGEKYPNLLLVFAIPAPGQDAEAVEKEIDASIEEAMTSKPLTGEELDGFKTRTRSSTIAACDDNQQLAGALAEAQMVRGDWREVFRDIERVQRLEPADVKSALEKAIRRENRTVAMIVPPRTAAAQEGGQP